MRVAGRHHGDSAPALVALGSVVEAGGPVLSRLLGLAEARLGQVAEGYGDALAEHALGTLAA